MTAAPEWVNARDFASIQAAVDSLGTNYTGQVGLVALVVGVPISVRALS